MNTTGNGSQGLSVSGVGSTLQASDVSVTTSVGRDACTITTAPRKSASDGTAVFTRIGWNKLESKGQV